MEVVVVSPIKNPLSFKGNPLEPPDFRKRRLAIPTLVDETSVSWFFRLKAGGVGEVAVEGQEILPRGDWVFLV